MDDMNKIEKPRKDYFKKEGIKTCKEGSHIFDIKTDKCKNNHCLKCGICQAVNGCFQIIKKEVCIKCFHEIQEDESAWFYLDNGGYYEGCSIICKKCMERLEKAMEELQNGNKNKDNKTKRKIE